MPNDQDGHGLVDAEECEAFCNGAVEVFDYSLFFCMHMLGLIDKKEPRPRLGEVVADVIEVGIGMIDKMKRD